MDLKQLGYFVAVAECGSFARAADLLAVAQPTLSRQVRALEVELKSSFFHRNGRGALLTPLGSRFLERARGVLHAADAAAEIAQDGDRSLTGKVVCGMTPSVAALVVPEYVRRFHRSLPGASLQVVNHLSTTLHDQLRASRLDFAILHNPPVSPSLAPATLSSEPLYLIGTARIGSTRDTVRLAELQGLPLLMASRLHAIRMPLEVEAARAGIELNVALEVDQMDAVLEIVADGAFHSVSTSFGLRAGRRWPTLHAQRIVAPEVFTQLSLVTPLPMAMTRLQRAAAELASSTYRDVVNAAKFSPAGRRR